MSNICNLCKTRTLEYIYTPLGSRMEAQVHICTTCGLLQTIPRLDDQNWPASISHLADFGGLRIGKGFRVGEVETFQPGTILDVGANRGAFYDKAKALWPEAELTAVEPDSLICRPEWINRRIEEVSFAPESFDLIYCVHTLEHLPDPHQELSRMNTWLRPGGTLYLEVPNSMCWQRTNTFIEEYFIDRHLYHFTFSTLRKMAELAGLRVLRMDIDFENITFRCSKSFPLQPKWDAEGAVMRQMMRDYRVKPAPVGRINAIPGLKVALGCGRIFSAFVANGLDLGNFVGFYDDTLAGMRVGEIEITASKPIPENVTPIAFSRHIKQGVRFDAGL